MFLDLGGLWRCAIPGQEKDVTLPGTLDENGVGHPETRAAKWHPDEHVNESLAESGVIATRFTRKVTYEGPAVFTRRVRARVPDGERVFLEAERARCLRLWVNGREVLPFELWSLATPWVFEVTDLITGDDEFRVVSDNSYPGLPHDDIVFSSAATDETQTNWNGIIGRFGLRYEKDCFISSVRVLPKGDRADVYAALSSRKGWTGALRCVSDAFEEVAEAHFSVHGEEEVCFRDLKIRPDAEKWDIGRGVLHTVTLSGDGLEEREARFGIRGIRAEEGHISLNGRRIFIRSEANCAVFPETGHPPMDKVSWKRILFTLCSYGINCVRFHSHEPPDAAFEAADEMGVLMQPELGCWNPVNAFESDESFAYYRLELEAVLRRLACHPSFTALTLGNELHAGDLGHKRMAEMLSFARSLDPTRLYAIAGNPHYGRLGPDADSDFYTTPRGLRYTHAGMGGPLNREYPSARTHWGATVEGFREKGYFGPVISFEVGQYEVLPALDEIGLFRGVTRPDNLTRIRDLAREAGMDADWDKRVEASGELSLLCYRAEAEAAFLTEDLSGISLLGLQDFPGQGTALVGMLNSHLLPKPYPFAAPERFSAFFRDALPLALLEKFTYASGERLRAEVRMVNYGKEDLNGRLSWRLGASGGEGERTTAPRGRVTRVGTVDILLRTDRPEKLTLEVSFGGETHTYPVWVYPDTEPACPAGITECRSFGEKARAALAAGGRVFLCPDSAKEALPRSIQGQFSTDFWSVGTFTSQEGGMGLMIREDHPLFDAFPTEGHTDWQWWPMASQRALIVPREISAIVTQLDSYATMRPMAMLFECRCGGGKLMVSSMGLHRLPFPEARALLRAIYAYMASDRFLPSQDADPDLIAALVPPKDEDT